MSKIVIREITYKNFGKCLEISNMLVRLVVTIDFGPRIICYSFINGENIFWEDTARVVSNPEAIKCYGSPWYVYGGHRLWVAPEAFPRTYYADNTPVKYKIIENGVAFISDIQKTNQCQCEISVILSPTTSRVRILHKLTNCGAWDIRLSLWGVTVLSSGGLEVIPLPTQNTFYTPNKLLTFWSHTSLADPRIIWGEKYIALRQDINISRSFKVGLNSEHAFAMYFNHGDIFTKKYDLNKNGIYPDGGVSLETYTNNYYLEMESLGEYQTIAPNKSITHCEYWSLDKCAAPTVLDEAEIDTIIQEYAFHNEIC